MTLVELAGRLGDRFGSSASSGPSRSRPRRSTAGSHAAPRPSPTRSRRSGSPSRWKASDRADTELVLGALDDALWSRRIQPDRLVSHSAHGAQPTAVRFTQRLADAGIAASMGSVGDSYDNALAESFFSTLKVERVYRTSYRTREEAGLDLVCFIDGWYNPRRIQRELGWLSPDEYEEAYHRDQSSGSLASPAGTR